MYPAYRWAKAFQTIQDKLRQDVADKRARSPTDSSGLAGNAELIEKPDFLVAAPCPEAHNGRVPDRRSEPMNLQTFLDERGVAYRLSRHETAFTASGLSEPSTCRAAR